MRVKLFQNVVHKVVNQAKQYDQKHNVSGTQLGPTTLSLKGSLKMRRKKSYKQLLAEALVNKALEAEKSGYIGKKESLQFLKSKRNDDEVYKKLSRG